MMSAFVLAAAVHGYAPTYQEAATQAVSDGTHVARVVRANRIGRFAVVLTRGGVMDGRPFTDPIYLEHFSFGWQPVRWISTTCDIVAIRERAGETIEHDLMYGMPAVQRYAKCRDDFRDVGHTADVEAVRQKMRGGFVPGVRVADDWALGVWELPGGGVQLMRRHGSGWVHVTGGGGVLKFSDALQYGVPPRDACALGFYDAPPDCK